MMVLGWEVGAIIAVIAIVCLVAGYVTGYAVRAGISRRRRARQTH
jgi:hypothetical protein